MPRYDISPRERKLKEQGQRQQLDIDARAADRADMTSNLATMASLYGLQEAQQLSPEKLRGAKLANDEAQFNQAWAQPRAEQAFNMGETQRGATEALGKSYSEISPQMLMTLFSGPGGIPDYVRDAVLSGGDVGAAVRSETQRVQAGRDAAIAQDKQQQSAPLPAGPPPGYALGSLPHKIAPALSGMETNMGNTGMGFWGGLLGFDPNKSYDLPPEATAPLTEAQRAGIREDPIVRLFRFLGL